MIWLTRRVRPTTLGFAIALVLIGCVVPACGLAAETAASSPFAGTALWVNAIPPLENGQQLLAQAAGSHVRMLYVKAADGSSPEPQFTSTLLGELHAAGVTVCAWTFAYGVNPAAEAQVAVNAVREGAQCLVVDAEEQYDGLYGAAQLFVHTLRADLGAAFPIGLAGQAEVSEHPTFPYSVFLGPGGFNVDMPQMYWLEIGVSVARAYRVAIAQNAIYGRPIVPVGQLYNSPATAEVTRFRQLAGAYGALGLSFFDLDRALPEQLASLAAPVPRLARRAVLAETLRPDADSDQVDWAQELLNAGGARLPVGGFFGAQTAHAVATFQAKHRLRSSGVIDAATWKALLRLRAREPSWAGGPPDSASS
jgi:hypothetical protein